VNLHDVVLLVAGGRRLELVPVLRNAEVHLGRRGGRGIVRLSGPLFRQEVAVVPWNFRVPVVLGPHFYGVNESLQIFRHTLLL